MICSRIPCSHIAIAALAGIAIITTTTIATAAGHRDDRNAGADDGDRIRAENISDQQIPLVLERQINNDAFDSAESVAAPDAVRFEIRGDLSKADTDGLCRDTDFYRIEGLEPLGEFLVGVEGDIAAEAQLGWFGPDNGVLILSVEFGLAGKLLLTADENGVLLVAVSAASDDDYDGNDDNMATPHGLCGQYFVHVELLIFGDVNSDTRVDIGDVRSMLSAIGSTENPAADLTNDGIVDAQDLRILADTVTDRRAQRLASNKANRIDKRKANAAKKAARKAARLAAANKRKASRKR